MSEVKSLRERVSIAETLVAVKQVAAESVTEDFFVRHPDWIERYGEMGRIRGIEDAKFHIDFLAGAIESGSTAPFEDYAHWCTRMLRSRGIEPHFLAENLRQIGAALRNKLPADSVEMVLSYIEAGAAACSEPGTDVRDVDDGDFARIQRLFLDSILKGRRKAASTIALEAVSAGHRIEDVYVDVFQKSQYELGRLWEANKISVAEEHMATAITQFVMAQVYPLIEPADTVRGKMVLAGVEGEFHQIGLNMIADVLEIDGWDVRFLGTNMPHRGIIEAVEETGADVLGISATMLFNLPKVVKIIDQVRAKFDRDQVKIIVGGSCFSSSPGLWTEIGADGFAKDLRSVSSVAASVLS